MSDTPPQGLENPESGSSNQLPIKGFRRFLKRLSPKKGIIFWPIVAILGAAMGLVMAETIPALITALSIGGLGGTAGLALPFIFATLIGSGLALGIAYLIYRAIDRLGSPPSPSRNPVKAKIIELNQEKKSETLSKGLKAAQGLCLPSVRENQDRQAQVPPNYDGAIEQFNALLQKSECKENPVLKAALEWQLKQVRSLKSFRPEARGEASEALLTQLESKLQESSFQFDLVAGHWENACQFVAMLAATNDSMSALEQRARKGEQGPVFKAYTSLIQAIQKGNKKGALAAITQLKQARQAAPTEAARRQEEEKQVDAKRRAAAAAAARAAPPSSQQIQASFDAKAQEFEAKIQELFSTKLELKEGAADPDYKAAAAFLESKVKPLLDAMNPIIDSAQSDEKLYTSLDIAEKMMRVQWSFYQDILATMKSSQLNDAQKADWLLNSLATRLNSSEYFTDKEALTQGIALCLKLAERHELKNASPEQKATIQRNYEQLRTYIREGHIHHIRKDGPCALTLIAQMSPKRQKSLEQMDAFASVFGRGHSPAGGAPQPSPAPYLPPAAAQRNITLMPRAVGRGAGVGVGVGVVEVPTPTANPLPATQLQPSAHLPPPPPPPQAPAIPDAGAPVTPSTVEPPAP